MESPDDIAWNHMVDSLFVMLDSRTNFIEADSSFRKSSNNFENLKLKRYIFDQDKNKFKRAVDSYITRCVEKILLDFESEGN